MLLIIFNDIFMEVIKIKKYELRTKRTCDSYL